MNVPLLLSPKVKISYLFEDNTLRQGVEKFRAHGFTAVPVLSEEGLYRGTVSDRDFLKFIMKEESFNLKELENVLIKDILRTDFNPPVHIDASLDELLERLMDTNFVPVIDGRDCFVGIVTRKSLLGYLRSSPHNRVWNTVEFSGSTKKRFSLAANQKA